MEKQSPTDLKLLLLFSGTGEQDRARVSMHQEALLLSQCLHLLAGAASDLNGEELEEFAALMQKNTAK